MKGKIIYRDLSYRIMEAVFEVHNTLGPGFLEKIYEEALAIEFDLRGIAYERQRQLDIYYKGRHTRKRPTCDLAFSSISTPRE